MPYAPPSDTPTGASVLPSLSLSFFSLSLPLVLSLFFYLLSGICHNAFYNDDISLPLASILPSSFFRSYLSLFSLIRLVYATISVTRERVGLVLSRGLRGRVTALPQRGDGG